MLPLLLPRTGAWVSGIKEFCHAHEYLSQLQIKRGGTVTTSVLVYYAPCCLFHHTNISFSMDWLFLILDYPQLVLFSWMELYCSADEVVKTHQRNLHILLLPIPVSYLLSPRSIPPVYGIISRCPMYRIQVASDSAGNLSSFELLLEFIWSVSEIQQPIERFSKVALDAGSNPRPTFHQGFTSEELLFPVETQVFLKKLQINGKQPR